MKYAEYKYIEVAIGGVYNRNNIKIAASYKIPEGGKDCYRTVYRYPEEFNTFYKQEKTVKGYNGTVYADFLPIDIDNEDLEKAHNNTKNLLNMLLNNYEVDLEQVKIYFSGAKGFHILLPADMFGVYPDYYIPQAFKVIAKKITGEIEIDSAIYDRVRLFRFSNTINSTTGLYKVALAPAEVLHKSIEEIKLLAEKPRHINGHYRAEKNEYLAELFRSAMREVKKPKENPPAMESTIRPPKNAKLCYYKILEGVSEGNRDNAGLRLGVHLLKEYPPDIVLPMLQAWNKRNNLPMDEDNVVKLFRQAQGEYDYGCKDPILAEYCNSNCILKGRKEEKRVTPDKIYSMEDAKSRYLEYIAKLKERKINLGFSKIDDCIRGIAPGEVCQVMARTGVGKTALALNVLSSVSINQDVPVLFFSLEQPLAQIYERAVQISNELSGKEVEHGCQDQQSMNLSHEIAQKCFGNVFVVEEDFLTYEELKEFVYAAEEKIGRKPPLVCVDYLGRMKGGHGNVYEITSELAKLLKVLAKELDIAILYLHQTSRAGGTGSEELSLNMGRDSGVVEEAADFILGQWRPDMNSKEAQEKDSEEMVIGVLKNRKGRLGQATYRFIKKHLKIQEWDKFYVETDGGE